MNHVPYRHTFKKKLSSLEDVSKTIYYHRDTQIFQEGMQISLWFVVQLQKHCLHSAAGLDCGAAAVEMSRQTLLVLPAWLQKVHIGAGIPKVTLVTF